MKLEVYEFKETGRHFIGVLSGNDFTIVHSKCDTYGFNELGKTYKLDSGVQNSLWKKIDEIVISEPELKKSNHPLLKDNMKVYHLRNIAYKGDDGFFFDVEGEKGHDIIKSSFGGATFILEEQEVDKTLFNIKVYISVCNIKDQFNRKVGIQEALNRGVVFMTTKCRHGDIDNIEKVRRLLFGFDRGIYSNFDKAFKRLLGVQRNKLTL